MSTAKKPTPESPPVRTGRAVTPRPESAATRERILDCAEELFALHGFDGTSVRDIASLANVQFALVGYHFGSKADLLDHVVARRVAVLNGERREHLQRALKASGGAPLAVATLLEGLVGCFIARAASDDAGWQNYAQLVAALANSPARADLIDKHFNDNARVYLKEFHRALPKASKETLYQAFFFSIGTMVAVCARPGRLETLSGGKLKSNDIARLNSSLCSFIEAGFRQLAE